MAAFHSAQEDQISLLRCPCASVDCATSALGPPGFARIIEHADEVEPSKPTKPGFVGFVGSIFAESINFPVGCHASHRLRLTALSVDWLIPTPSGLWHTG